MFQNSNVSTVASLPYCTHCKEWHRPCTIMRLVSVHLVLNNKHSVSTVRVACPNSRTNILKDDYWQQRVMLTYSFDLTEWLKNRLFHYSTNTIWFLTVVGLYVSRTCDFECSFKMKPLRLMGSKSELPGALSDEFSFLRAIRVAVLTWLHI